MDIKEERLKFLEDTITYYSADVNRRCVGESSETSPRCKYSPKNAAKEGVSDGCAMGRHMTAENKLKADNVFVATSDSGIANVIDLNPDILPTSIVALGKDFLGNMQELHDLDRNWVDSGLSSQGKNKVERIKKFYIGN